MANYMITGLGGGLGYTWSDVDLTNLETVLEYALRIQLFPDGGQWAREKLEQISRLRGGRTASQQYSDWQNARRKYQRDIDPEDPMEGDAS